MQTSKVGLGVSALTEDIAVAVVHARPAAPSVVMTFTVAATRLIPSRKRCLRSARSVRGCKSSVMVITFGHISSMAWTGADKRLQRIDYTTDAARDRQDMVEDQAAAKLFTRDAQNIRHQPGWKKESIEARTCGEACLVHKQRQQHAAPRMARLKPGCLEKNWSGRRDSNSRPQPWQGCALPLSYARILIRVFTALPPRGVIKRISPGFARRKFCETAQFPNCRSET